MSMDISGGRGLPAAEAVAGDAAGDAAEASVSLLQVVADPVRWVVLQRLAAQPSCVCNLQEHIPVAGNLLSYHLKVLREAGLVTSSRRGRWIDYALADDALDRLHAALPGARSLPAARPVPVRVPVPSPAPAQPEESRP